MENYRYGRCLGSLSETGKLDFSVRRPFFLTLLSDFKNWFAVEREGLVRSLSTDNRNNSVLKPTDIDLLTQDLINEFEEMPIADKDGKR